MRREIILPRGVSKQKLAADMKTTLPTIWRALIFESNSALAQLIREEAIRRGGVEVIFPDRGATTQQEQETA